MLAIQFDVSLNCDKSVRNDAELARLWIDPKPFGGALAEAEVPLVRTGDGRWSGLALLEPGTRCFFYRLGLVGSTNCAWTLTLRDTGSEQVLHTDGDELPLPKCYFVGTCSLAKPERTSGTRGLAPVRQEDCRAPHRRFLPPR